MGITTIVGYGRELPTVSITVTCKDVPAHNQMVQAIAEMLIAQGYTTDVIPSGMAQGAEHGDK